MRGQKKEKKGVLWAEQVNQAVLKNTYRTAAYLQAAIVKQECCRCSDIH